DLAHELGPRRHPCRARPGAVARRRTGGARAGDRLRWHRRARPRGPGALRRRQRGARGIGLPRRRRHRPRHQRRPLTPWLLDAARAWLDAGAAKIMLGTAASPELCGALPRERVIAAVDADKGQVVVDGWRRDTGVSVLERIRALAPVVGGFLFTQVEREGAMDGFDFQAVAAAVRAAGSLARAVEERRGVYWSRSRQALWVKGETSGNTQQLLRVDLDCDRDALRFTVRQHGAGFCHLERRACWPAEFALDDLERTVVARATSLPLADPESRTGKLLGDPVLLAAKLREEAAELAEAATRGEVVHETADLLYMALVALVR